jgi:hypothetical protein
MRRNTTTTVGWYLSNVTHYELEHGSIKDFGIIAMLSDGKVLK